MPEGGCEGLRPGLGVGLLQEEGVGLRVEPREGLPEPVGLEGTETRPEAVELTQ